MRGFRKFPCSNSRRFLPLAFAAFVAGLLLSGCCGHTEYVIEMEPEGGKLNRKLSIIEHAPPPTPTESGAAKAEPPPNPAETASPNVEPENFPEGLRRELERVEALYATRHSNYSSNTHTFQGSFSGKLPNDVGGAGSFMIYSNSFGTASVYVERFRGNDDPAGQLQKQARAIDKCVDHITGWSAQELGAKRGFDKLRVFLDQNLRQDLKNLGLHAVRGEVLSGASSKENQIEFGFRAALFLVERGYFETAQIPEIMRRFSEDDETASLRIAQRLFADKMEIDPKELTIFEDPEAFEKSGEAYLRSTRDYRELVSDWKTAKEDDPELPKPEPGDVIGNILEPLGDAIVLFPIDDSISLSLKLPGRPLYSNGQWDGKKLIWKRNLESADANSAPMISYATWVTPNDAGQRRLFGEVILDGEMLLQTCLGVAGLTPEERRDLEKGLRKLPTAAELKPQFDALRAQIKTEASGSGDPIYDDLFSLQAWELIRSKLPEPFGDAK